MDFENNQFPQQAPVQPQQAPFQAPVQPQQAPYAPVAPQQAPFQAPYQAPQQAPAQLPQANKGKSKLPMLIGVVAVVAIVAVLAVVLLGGSGYKKAFKKSMDYYFNYETKNIEDLLPEAVWEEAADVYDMEVDELVDELIEEAEDDKEWADEEGIKYSYEIGDYEEMDSDDLDDLKENIADIHESIDEDDIGDKAYIVEVNYEVTYEDDETEDEEEEFCIVEISGDWYVVDEAGFFCVYNIY